MPVKALEFSDASIKKTKFCELNEYHTWGVGRNSAQMWMGGYLIGRVINWCPGLPPWLSLPTLFAVVAWALSRKARNRIQHALNGNPGHPRVPVGVVFPKELRAAGWEVNEGVENPCKVFDLRLAKAMGVCGVSGMEEVQVVGGDFLTASAQGWSLLEDGVALATGPPKAWGKRVFVNPRPQHLGRWVLAVMNQVKLEGVEKVVMGCVVTREKIGTGTDKDVCLPLPAIHLLFHTKGLVGKARALSTRPGVLRVPEQGTRLPPVKWEETFLSVEEVLVVVEVTAGDGVSSSELEWDAAMPPKVVPGLEDLVVEVVLAPGTRQLMAVQLLQAGVRKLAKVAEAPSLPFVRSVKVSPNGALAWGQVSVPRDRAVAWLKASGVEGVVVRPFFTCSTGEGCRRERFALRWLKGAGALGKQRVGEIWKSVQGVKGVYGVVTAGVVLAIRVDLTELDGQGLDAALKAQAVEMKPRQEGVKWWCLERMQEKELWRIADVIGAFGLTLVGGWRCARGAFRSRVFFQAGGAPTRQSLDGGGWEDSEVVLREAAPPPTGLAEARRQVQVMGLPKTATWGGVAKTTE